MGHHRRDPEFFQIYHDASWHLGSCADAAFRLYLRRLQEAGKTLPRSHSLRLIQDQNRQELERALGSPPDPPSDLDSAFPAPDDQAE